MSGNQLVKEQKDPSRLDQINDPEQFVSQTRHFLSFLSRQEQRFVYFYMKGNSPGQSAVAAGFQARKGKALLLENRIVNALEAYAGREMEEAQVTKESLTQLTMEAHSNSVNATEQLQAIDRLARLHGLFDTQKTHPTVQINQQINGSGQVNNQIHSTVSTRLKGVDDEALLEASGFDIDGLIPTAKRRAYDMTNRNGKKEAGFTADQTIIDIEPDELTAEEIAAIPHG
jgi:phage terminase small subunit